MNLTGNTIFITGGGTGIGRGLAESLHKLGNKVIISGRRRAKLDETLAANPGMEAVELDVESPASIAAAAKELIAKFPQLNVVINNAGIMSADLVQKPVNDAQITSTVTTNLLGPIRVTSAFIEHLKQQPSAAIVYVTSGLAFLPLAISATYSATKAGIHSFAMSQRFLLKETNVRVLEIAPPYVQTELNGAHQATDPMAMPLNEFIDETMRALATDSDEVLTERVQLHRKNPGPNEYEFVEKFNGMMAARNAELFK